ncbi:U32 family peptidase [Pseudoalteromonas sp. SWXJZ94C]|uniref:peptidase U32 family protein n=1 Tax=unclassified Pseudoalteromonas TaxID=194690 RepID=UPI0004298806|nr:MULTISPECIES: peptidase U32 family protein [unclassified Pseudoalteromonas]MBH0058761.1 U32 family peptidase [Pseudoalteromonas sp. SWXJZ94C]
MSRKIELLAPGGDVNAVKAAIVAGANAVYCGLDTFNARNRASNLSFDELNGALRLAHEYGCEIFLTLNVVILEHEMGALFKLLNQLVNTTLDGIIVQDLGLFNIVKKHFPTLHIHASTQLTTHNESQVEFLARIGATRVNLSRELNLTEIKILTDVAHKCDVLTEVFVHGALCIAFSGQCYSSSVSVGNSGNRGRCSQACRDEYEPTAMGNKHPLNLKDNSAYFDLPELVAAGVDSLKVEGRIKGANYVHTVIDSWRKQIDTFVQTGNLIEDDSSLYKVFNRNFTNKFLTGDMTKNMFTDNPRDHSFDHANEKNNAISVVQIYDAQQELSTQKSEIDSLVKKKIEFLDISKRELTFEFSGQLNQPFTVNVIIESKNETMLAGSELTNAEPSQRFEVQSQMLMQAADKSVVDMDAIEKRFKTFSNANFNIKKMDYSNLGDNLTVPLSIPFKELARIKKQVAFLLNEGKDVIAPVELPKLVNHEKEDKNKTTLSILISDIKDIYLCDLSNVDVYFKLPESFRKNNDAYINIFLENPQLIPYFPAVMIGKDFEEAVRLLETVKPKLIISNNTGVAFKAVELGIDWIAGPLLNTTNSYALLTLQEDLNAKGAFISNEINKQQMRSIKRPNNFKMMYSIYHPILMMTSRQCFFQQTVGCKKPRIDASCMLSCKKETTVTNVKGISFAIDKQKGGYPSIYNHEQFLNMDIVTDYADKFDEFFIDLTDIGSGDKDKLDKAVLLEHFQNLISGQTQAQDQLNQMVKIQTRQQYVEGLNS